MNRNNRNIILLLIALLTLVGYIFTPEFDLRFNLLKEFKPGMLLGKNYDYANILVIRAVDGDTLLLENKERVRLIGIDTPEMHESDKLHRDAQRSGQDIESIKQLGRQSYQFTRRLVEGNYIRLEFDVERFDKYKRLLAYVFLPDGTFLNAKLVEDGYASLMTYPPNIKYVDLFSELYKDAHQNQRGLWGSQDVPHSMRTRGFTE